jgi:photosystem I subunit IX
LEKRWKTTTNLSLGLKRENLIFLFVVFIARGFRTFLISERLTSVFHFVLTSMKDFTTYLSTAPVVALGWFTVTAALLIEINRFFPDPLVFSF